MRLSAIRLDKIVVGGDQDRFIATFHIEYEDVPGEMPFGAHVAIGTPFDADLSHKELVERSLNKLHDFLRVSGNTDLEAVHDLFERGLKPFYFTQSLGEKV